MGQGRDNSPRLLEENPDVLKQGKGSEGKAGHKDWRSGRSQVIRYPSRVTKAAARQK